MPPDMAPSSSTLRVSYVSFFTRSVVTLPSFYVDVFGLSERQASRSERYRELELGDLRIGFPYIDAYAMLNMSDQADPTGSRTLLTFAAEDPAAVERLTRDAVAHGARLVKGPFSTNFGQFLSVILDPEGNALRISAPAAA